MSEREIQELQKSFNELRVEFLTLQNIIKPMAESYNAMTKLGGWVKYLLWFAGALIGLLLALRELIKK